MSRRIGVVVCVVGLLWATPAGAQSQTASSSPSKIGVHAFGHFEWQKMTAKKTFDAVTGKTSLTGLGGGIEVRRLWQRLFARVSLSRMSKTGERVFVFDNEVFPLGIPLELKMTPIEATVGWRSAPSRSRGIVSYLGGGFLSMKYEESSAGDAAGEGVDETYSGIVLFGGVEVPVWRLVSTAAEIGWRKVNVPDPGGTLEAFGEKGLGGLTMRVMVSIGR